MGADPNTQKAKVISQQIIGFGVERYDDLVDAVSMGLNYIHAKVQWVPGICIFDMDWPLERIEKARTWKIKYLE